jgi:hypothetical protein
MQRRSLTTKDPENGEFYEVVEWRVIAVWNDGLVEDWGQDLANDSTLAMEIETYCIDYEDLRNIDPNDYNTSKWSV